VKLSTRLNDCCGMCIRENGPASVESLGDVTFGQLSLSRSQLCGIPDVLVSIAHEIIPLTVARVISFGRCSPG